MWVKTVALLRYHLSPHSLDLVGIGRLAQERSQAPCDLDLYAARPGWVAVDRDRFDEIANGAGGFRIAVPDALRQSFLKPGELLLVTSECCRVKRDDILCGRGGFEFGGQFRTLANQNLHSVAEEVWIAETLCYSIDKPIDLFSCAERLAASPRGSPERSPCSSSSAWADTLCAWLLRRYVVASSTSTCWSRRGHLRGLPAGRSAWHSSRQIIRRHRFSRWRSWFSLITSFPNGSR